MTTIKNDKTQKDPELQQALDAISQLRPSHTPDVTDSVMQRIASMPQPTATTPSHRLSMRLVSALAAACFAGIVVVTFIISHNNSNVQAANISPEMPNRLYDIYNYCHDYADDETIESAAYYDNPITDFI